MATPVTNFGKVTVSTGYDASATSIVLTTGHGSRLPSTFPYPLTWWNATDYPDPADDPNREIVTVTARSTDTLTVTRGAESSGASTKNTSGKTYKMLLGITKAMWEDLEARTLTQSFRNLRVMRHPNSSETSKIQFNADAIVLNDGQEITGWDDVTVNISTTGANGLDTGAPASNVCYDLYAIYNGTTKAGLLHLSKSYNVRATNASGEDGGHALRDATARTKLAQGFQVTATGPCEFAEVKLVKTGSPTGQFWLTIEQDATGVPDNSPVATSDKYDVALLTTTATTVRIPFRTPFTLNSGSQYHLVLQGDFTVSGANYISWRADTSAAAYASGAKAAYDGATWTTDTDDDFIFSVYVTEGDTTPTWPTGYTYYAHIGYAITATSPAFKPFTQKDRTIFCGLGSDWKVGDFTETTASLKSLGNFLPPVGVVASFAVYNGSAATVSIGGLNVTDMSAAVSASINNTVRQVTGAATMEGMNPIVLSPFQGMMFCTSAGTASTYITSFTW